MPVSFTINGVKESLNVAPNTPLLWVLRDHLQLTGSKYGCGIAQCGACSVYVDDQVVRACVIPIVSVAGKVITTIEGVKHSKYATQARAIQQAWEQFAIAQCGFCQSGQIMSATVLLANQPMPSEEDIDAFMSGNLCRCATYVRIKKAIKQAANNLVDSIHDSGGAV